MYSSKIFLIENAFFMYPDQLYQHDFRLNVRQNHFLKIKAISVDYTSRFDQIQMFILDPFNIKRTLEKLLET